MKSVRLAVLAAVSCLAFAGWVAAAEVPAAQGQPVVVGAEGESVALTVYNDGNAIVKETRAVSVPKGASEVRFEDVAATIDPTSVTFKSITDPQGTALLEQNYEYDLVSADKILAKYLGKVIHVTTQSGTAYEGTLLSFDPAQIVVSSADGGINVVARQDNVKSVTTGSLPEGLIIKPTLMWLLESAAGGEQKVEVAYSASQCSWKADYSAILDKDDKLMDFSGWVTLTNNSGKTYKDAGLKLIAGEVHRAEQPQAEARAGAMMLREVAAAPQFEEKAFAEYHMYTLPRATTIKDNQIKQIELLSASSVPVEKKYLYDSMRGFHPWWNAPMMEDQFSVGEKGKVQTFVIFHNDEKSNMGMPLPAGRVRLFKYDGKDLEFVGEDSIDHTPKDERVEINMGVAFDITAERTRTNFVRGNGANWMEESFKILIRNHKDAAVIVYDREHLFRWTNWKITQKSQDYTKLDSQTVEFPVEIAANGEVTVTYTARYEW